MIALTGQELLSWNDETAKRLEKLLGAHPEALKIACDIRETHTVGDLLQHIVAVELRYAERLSGQPETDYSSIPTQPVAEIFAVHQRAVEAFASLLAREEAFWEQEIEFTTRSRGEMKATRRKIFAHALLHSIRHYAQLATLLRHNGVVVDWGMDYLFAS